MKTRLLRKVRRNYSLSWRGSYYRIREYEKNFTYSWTGTLTGWLQKEFWFTPWAVQRTASKRARGLLYTLRNAFIDG